MTDNQQPENAYPQRLGSKLVIAAWIVFLGLLTLFFSNYLDKQRNPNSEIASYQQQGKTEIILEQNRGGHYVATAEINGHPVEVLLDTGASSVSIPENMANAMRLERGPEMIMSTANGNISVYATRLREVRLGEIVLHDVRAHINPYMDEDFVLLGMSFLKQLSFSQQGKQLVIRQSY